MPYVDQNTRAQVARELNALGRLLYGPGTGLLNYVITRSVIAWLGPRPDYERFNAVIGVLGCVQSELYRRMVAPYEDVKRAESGDVYPLAKDSFCRGGTECNCPKGGTPHERE